MEDRGEARQSGIGQAPNWRRRKGLSQARPNRCPADPSPLTPSSLLCSVFPWSLSEAQVAEQPLSEGINTLN